MKTALEIVNAAIDLEVRGKKHLTFFKFVFDGIEVEYWGCYYGYACHPDGHDEYEFGGDSFDEMLADVIPQTGKNIREMLEALPEDAIEVEFDPLWPVTPAGSETNG